MTREGMLTQEEAKEILLQAFSALNDEEVSNLKFHLKRETPTLCLKDWHLFTDGMGGG